MYMDPCTDPEPFEAQPDAKMAPHSINAYDE